ncbi:hypothetical protein AAFC00_004770 [Neodothiora populina]|uniref:Arabinanase/levansucrase/invertase n=1 Tax=Neodothiora populina TaxID=2781224 RepID=A0ABR3P4H8_9PEZI
MGVTRGIVVVLWLALGTLSTPLSSTAIFTNTRRLLFDTDGNQVDAYGSKVSFFENEYYLYGNSFSTKGEAFGIKSYSSVDLESWTYNGFIFNPEEVTVCQGSGACGRPHIVYNPNTKQYILWANAGSSGYVVASASRPTGPFEFSNITTAIDPQFNGLQPADFTVEIVDGKGYIVFSALNFMDPSAGSIWPPVTQTLHISELTDDLMNTTMISYPVASTADDLIDDAAESPDIFKHDGSLYISASNTCGYCNGSIGLLYRSYSIEGPWTRQILAGYSCNGQVEGVLQLSDPETGNTTNVWHSTTVPGGVRTGWGGHIFQPLIFDGTGNAQELDCSDDASFSVPFKKGNATTTKGKATKAVDATPALAVYAPVCDSDSFLLYQTWIASKSGELQSVSLNVARGSQTVPLSLTVFKFGTYNDIYAPNYKWTKLGSVSLNANQTSYTFDTVTVQVSSNATVTEGDHLGLAISGQDFSPWCHLEFSTDGISGLRLFQQGQGQNSWRGSKGDTSPVYERTGKSVKFFATYA